MDMKKLQEVIDTIEEFAPENRIVCGFYAVNKDHCWANGHCTVCKIAMPTPTNLRKERGEL